MKKALVIIIIAAIMCAVAACNHREIVDYDTYTVHSGDTLWNIAKVYYGEELDVRDAIKDIENANNCGPVIQPGQELLIPIYR